MAAPLAPMVMNGVVFALSGGQRNGRATLYALDGSTGKEYWNSGNTITRLCPAEVWPAAPASCMLELMTGLFMRLVSRSSISLLAVGALWAQQLPDGPGKAETVKLCSQCHEIERSVSLRQGREGWQGTIDKMITMGAKGTDQEWAAILDYLSKNYAADEAPKLNVNKATAIELESGLSLRRSEAAAVIRYREKNGDFKSIEDLKKVPGIDTAKIESKKDRLAF